MSSFSGIQIILQSLDDKPISLKSMTKEEFDVFRKLLDKVAEEKNINDLEVCIDEGSWKIILFSAFLTTANIHDIAAANFSKLKSFVAKKFDSPKVYSFDTFDKKIIPTPEDSFNITSSFFQSTNNRRVTNDNIIFFNGKQVDEFVIPGDSFRISSNSKVRKYTLKNGLSFYFNSMKVEDVKNHFDENNKLCVIDNGARFAGIVGIFNNSSNFNKYINHYNSILSEYNTLLDESVEIADIQISKKIIAIFREELKDLNSNNSFDVSKFQNIHSFLSLFINRNFSKRIHFNIITAVAFMAPDNFPSDFIYSVKKLYASKTV
jgi:hypothetical protein